MIRNALKQFFTYGVGSVAQTALNFVLLPILLRFFEPGEYGIISLLLVTVSLLTTLFNVGIVSGLHRLYFEAGVQDKKKLIGTALLWYFFGAILVGIILFSQSSRFSQILFHSKIYSYPVKTLGVFFFFSMLRTIPFEVFRLEKKANFYVGFSLLSFAVDFAMKLCFIMFLKRGIGGYFEAGIIAYMIVLCSILPFALKYMSFCLNTSYLKQLLRLGFPFIFSGISMWILTMSDRFILNYFCGETEVGIYSLSYAFANLFNVFLFSPSALFFSPFFFSYAAERSIENTKRLLSKSLIYFFLSGCVLFLIISLGSGDMLRIFTSLFSAKQQYWQSAKIVPLLTLGPFFYLLSRQAGYALLMAKKPEFIAAVAIIAAVVNVELNFIFIPRFGILGAAIATAIAYALFVGLCYWWAQKIWPVNHNWKKLSKGSLFLGIAFIIGWQITIVNPWLSLFVRVLASVIIFVLCVWFISDILTKNERNKILIYLTEEKRKFVMRLSRKS